MDALYTHNGKSLDMATTSDRVSDPISGKSVKAQIDQLALQISGIIADGNGAANNIAINTITVEGITLGSTSCSSSSSSIAYYTRIVPNKEYAVDVDITSGYSRLAVTCSVPANKVPTLGYTAGSTGTKKYRLFIDAQGNAKVYINANTEPKVEFAVDVTKELYLVVAATPECITLIDIHFPDEVKNENGAYPTIEQQLVNVDWNRKKFGSKTLLWFTDCHAMDSGSTTSWLPQLQATMDFAKKHKTSIDDIIHTGDSVRNNSVEWGDGTNWVNAGASGVLNVIGNHDVFQSDNSSTITASETYQMYFKTFINDWNVTHDGNEEHCYYYKDYSNGLRLIVIDQTRSTSQGSAQLTWIVNVLADAKANGKHVVVAAHYIPFNIPTKISSHFCALKSSFSYQTNESVLTAIDNYINDGGTFVCWIVGHSHADYLFKIPEHSGQVVICQDCLACRVDTTADRDRKAGTDSELCFNLITFDTSNKAISIARVGYPYDMFNRHKGGICLDYEGNIYGEW